MIQHKYQLTTEETANKLGACKNRSLSIYDDIPNKIRHMSYINEYPYYYFNKKQIRELYNRNKSFQKYTITRDGQNNLSSIVCKIC